MKLVIRTKNKNYDAPFFEMQQVDGEPKYVFTVDPNNNFEFTKILQRSTIENEVLEFSLKTDRDKDYLLEQLDEFDEIYISPYDTNIAHFLEINEDLQTKKIILLGKYTVLDSTTLMDLRDKLHEYEDNIYVNLEGNKELVPLSTACRTTDEIDNIKLHIENLDLSPLEKVMYVYDIVRTRIYTKEGKKQGSEVSRDLSKILFNNRIVCVGYSELFKAILKSLGIESNIVVTKPSDNDKNRNGHERNTVIIKDEKYNVDGLYYFDVTWDSKKFEFDNDYINRYRYFGLNQEEMDEVNNISKQDMGFSFKDINLTEMINDLQTYFKINNFIVYPSVDKINTISKICYGKLLAPQGYYNDKAENYVIKKLINMVDKINSPSIPKSTMEELILNVKKVEYQRDRELCPYDITNSKIYSTSKGTYYLVTPEFIKYHLEEIEKMNKENNPQDNIEKYIQYLDESTMRYEDKELSIKKR